MDSAICLRNLLVVAEAHALDVYRTLQRRQQFAHVERITFTHGAAALRRGSGCLADERGGSRLAARHAIDGVVDEDDGDILSAICCMEDFRRTDGRKVTVALIANDNALGTAALHCRCNRRATAMRRLHIAYVEVVIGKDGAADRSNENGPVLNAKIVNGASQQLVNDAMSAARTEVRLMLEFGLAIVALVERLCPALDYRVLGNQFARHWPCAPHQR